MADRTYIVRKTAIAKEETVLKKHTTLEVVSIDEADTVTVQGYTTIDNVKVVNLADGADVDASAVGNVVTIDEVGASGVHVIALVVGS